jgi:HPt (histidine-containing phosphotransfer) domain-containing protein
MMIHYLPKEKVQLVTEEGTATPPEKTSDILPTALFELDDIDPVAGIEHCGSEEDYMETLSIFSASIGSKSAKIEKAWQEQDLKNYTILVHSLKSTSRIVGASALSDLAFQLEMAGKEANDSLIAEKTPGLLEMYRSLQEPLDKILEDWESR